MRQIFYRSSRSGSVNGRGSVAVCGAACGLGCGGGGGALGGLGARFACFCLGFPRSSLAISAAVDVISCSAASRVSAVAPLSISRIALSALCMSVSAVIAAVGVMGFHQPDLISTPPQDFAAHRSCRSRPISPLVQCLCFSCIHTLLPK